MKEVILDIPSPAKAPKSNDTTPSYLPRFPFSLMLVGKRLSGKSSLLTACILEAWADNYLEILVFSPTCKSDAQWSTVAGLENVYFSESVTGAQLEAILTKQHERWKQSKRKNNRILIILDDMSSTIKNKKSGLLAVLDKYWSRCRHDGISIALCCQNLSHASTTIRGNSTNLWVFKVSDREAKILCDEHQVPWLTDKDFLQLLRYCTSKPYSFMNIDWSQTDPDLIVGKGFRTKG